MAGYRIDLLRTLMPQLRRAKRWDEVSGTLAAREMNIATRSRALLRGVALLDALLDDVDR